MQSAADLAAIDTLASVIGSRVRADVLAVLNADPTKVWTALQVGLATRRHKKVVEKELRHLATIGVIRAIPADNKFLYSADRLDPVGRDLARFVRQTRGPVPTIRKALAGIRSPVLAWLTGAGVTLAPASQTPDAILVVLTSAPRSLVRIQLARAAAPHTKIECMAVREWVTRLDKNDVLVRRLRRGRKQWIIGGWDELVRRERGYLDSVRSLTAAISNWRDELSDEWDEDWDPAPGLSSAPR